MISPGTTMNSTRQALNSSTAQPWVSASRRAIVSSGFKMNNNFSFII
jgi:hypothetical protein